jgi:hypothetical protein
MNLDEAYGNAIPADPLRTFENRKQSTWLLIDAESGPRLQALIDHCATDAYLSSYLNDEFNTLWLIAEDGTIRIAIEEFVLEDQPQYLTALMPRRYKTDAKIGHPGLVEGRLGRIGGEMAVNKSDGKCYLTNASGRFGYKRSVAELENAAEALRGFGVQVTAQYERSVW